MGFTGLSLPLFNVLSSYWTPSNSCFTVVLGAVSRFCGFLDLFRCCCCGRWLEKHVIKKINLKNEKQYFYRNISFLYINSSQNRSPLLIAFTLFGAFKRNLKRIYTFYYIFYSCEMYAFLPISKHNSSFRLGWTT